MQYAVYQMEMDTVLGPRSGRLFVSSPDQDPVPSVDGRMLVDEEDELREPRLREIVSSGLVRAVAHPLIDYPDVHKVFLETRKGQRLFACTLVSPRRMEQVLRESGWLFESFSLQVVSVDHLTTEALRVGVQAWIERAFPDVVPPRTVLSLWTDPSGLPLDLLGILTASVQASPGMPPIEGELDLGVADPPYEDAA